MAAVNGTILFIPTNGANVIQAGQGMPGVMIQPPGTVQCVGQPFGSPSSQPQQTQRVGALEKLLEVETKTLGAIQIILGLIHIGLGGVSIVLHPPRYIPLAAYSGYPFWSGIFFIVSGSLSVSTEKHLNFSLVKCAVGMNITSAVMALIGIGVQIAELAINSPERFHISDHYGLSLWYSRTGICVLLLLFTILEFCITVSTAHFGCEATCCKTDPTIAFVPYPVAGSAPPAEVMILGNRGNVDVAEGHSCPPSYEENCPASKNEVY
ncbi:membrane-spanning 4-domains subfamily A member 8-like isoform X2 [Tiliqua scincoides]